MNRIIILIISIFILSISMTYADDNTGFEIIPESEQSKSDIGNMVNDIGEGGSVWDNYKNEAYGKKVEGSRERAGSDMTLGDQLASGVMTRDTILDYAVYLVKFVGQLALLAGALGIIYFGYKKATEHIKFNGKLGKVVLGILVVSFAYVIVKIIWSMFVS